MAVIDKEWIAFAVNGQNKTDPCPYGIDDLYLTVSRIDPAIKWPGTSWILFGAGRVPVCVDEADPDLDEVGKTAGSNTVVLAIDQMPGHTHTSDAHAHSLIPGQGSQSAEVGTTTVPTSAVSGSVQQTGPTGIPGRLTYRAHVANIGWQETVSNGQVAGTTGQNLDMQALIISLTGDTGITVPGPTGFTGNSLPHENRQPSIACYIWRRLA
ncbi:MAG: hypothetical protein LBG81_01640 [Coriobacteriaceae bacterium]|nr:hypothetical protein [Coriobacteriaceae bacterium]